MAGAGGGSWRLVGLAGWCRATAPNGTRPAPKRSHMWPLTRTAARCCGPPIPLPPFLQLFLLFVVQAHNPLPAQYTSGPLLQSALRCAMKPVAAAKRVMARVASWAARGRRGGQAGNTAAAAAAAAAADEAAELQAAGRRAAERREAAQRAAAGERRDVTLDLAHDPEKLVADLPMRSHIVKAGPCCCCTWCCTCCAGRCCTRCAGDGCCCCCAACSTCCCVGVLLVSPASPGGEAGGRRHSPGAPAVLTANCWLWPASAH